MSKKSNITVRVIKRLGWIPDLPDHRDRPYKSIAPRVKALPPSVNLTANCSAIEDQGNLGSCTANALVGAMEHIQIATGAKYADLSRLFVYYNERKIEGTIPIDNGAYLRDGIKTLAKQGVCTEKSWPYKISDFAKKPSSAAYAEALKRQILSYYRLDVVDEMRACLADGFSFVFGFSVYESFNSSAVAKTGTVNLPKASEKLLGGHAVLGVGYNDKQKRFLCRNSWGTGWGKNGYFTMPYAYLANRNLSDDFWTIRSQESPKMSLLRR